MSEEMFLVRWRGRQAGPYTRVAIEEKLRNKELSLLHEVFCGGRWILMKEFIAQGRVTAGPSTEPMSIRTTEPSSLEHENVLGLPPETPPQGPGAMPTGMGLPSVPSMHMEAPLAQSLGNSGGPPLAGDYAGLNVPTYFALAVLSSMFCCLPLGLVAIWFASQVEGKQNAGNVAGALESSTAAKNWCIVAAILALAFWLVGGLGYVVTALALGRWR